MYKFKDIIEEVGERNTDLRYGLDDIVGVTIEKGLIPTVANLAQTSLEKFYIVKPETFVYNPRTHGVRLGMGFNNTTNIYITSWNNVAFRIKKEAQNIVIPYYLWLFFCRPIWDRLTNFLAWGSSTIVFAWKDFLNIDIVLPSIEYQREIVSEYETLTNRIHLNNQMIQNLEATAQALYRKTFVDNIDKENLPEGWRMGTIGDMLELQRGFDLPSQARVDGKYPIYTSTGIAEYHNEYKVEPPCIVTGRSGTIGEVFYSNEKCWPLNTTLWVKDFKGTPSFFVYYKLKELDLGKTVSGFAAVPTLNRNDVHMMETVVPPKDILLEFDSQMQIIHNNLCCIEQENEKLTELQSLLLAKMGQ